jgi:ABC-type dipeptide/oligopeptide/nickel transport system ATPase component
MGMAVMLITHDLEWQETADRVAVMYAEGFSNGPLKLSSEMRNFTPGPRTDPSDGKKRLIPSRSGPKPMGCSVQVSEVYLMIEECKKEEPPLFKVDEEHYSRCIRWKECC